MSEYDYFPIYFAELQGIYEVLSLLSDFRKESVSWGATGTDGAVSLFLLSAAALHFLFTCGCGAQLGLQTGDHSMSPTV